MDTAPLFFHKGTHELPNEIVSHEIWNTVSQKDLQL